MQKDPWNLSNLADDPAYAETKAKLARRLETWMAKTDDPRATNPNDDRWDKYPYTGPGEWVFPKPRKPAK